MVLQNCQNWMPGESRQFLKELFSLWDHLVFPKECIEPTIFSCLTEKMAFFYGYFK